MLTSRCFFALIIALGAVGAAGACSSSTTNEGPSAAGGTGGATDGGKNCVTASDCDDGNSCNGNEECSGGSCTAGTSLAEGTSCTPGGVAAESSGVTYQCGKGECLLTCKEDADCDDSNVCTGAETCGPNKTCQSGTPLSCDDGSICTNDECDPEGGCFYPLIDNDNDGQADKKLLGCGTDCNDDDASVYEGAPDPCNDKVDSNCNGKTDDAAPVWYADCDKDGFAPAAATTLAQCEKPLAGPSTCTSGGWTGVAPAAGTTDCADKEPDAHPYTATANGTAWRTTPIPGATTKVDFDYNCDGNEEKRYSTKGVLAASLCGLKGSGQYYSCSGNSGWTGAVVPECGEKAEFSKCGKSGLSSCTRVKGQQAQECR